MKRLLLPILLLVGSWPAGVTARVISYAPYTDQVAVRSHHERTTRYFALVESSAREAYDGLMYGGKVVLYDSTGAEAPRVVFPPSDARGYVPDVIRLVAMYQPDGEQPPVIVVVTGIPRGTETHISRNGGRSWRHINELYGLTPRVAKEPDRGGPWTQGLGAPVRIGTRSWPFVISFAEGVYAISATRPPKLLYAGPTAENSLLGQNRAGTQFLLLTHRGTLVTTDTNGLWRSAGNARGNPVSGWIADDGAIYTVRADENARQVYRHENRREELVASSDRAISFAVPTHDFAGFWYLEHEPKQTTILRRYTRAAGLETMWEDEDAPEVEALHTAASGDALLIQVHRRRAKQDLSFLDPALGLWRIGEPAPAGYDELFVNEGPRKGFVNLDVEAVAAGKPFVFDSGYVRPPPDIVVSPPAGGGGGGGGHDVIQEWGVVRASLEQRLVIHGVTRSTDLVIANPVDAPQSVRIEYGEHAATMVLDPLETRLVPHVLSALFAIEEGTGALHFLPAVGVNALAYVWTSDGASYVVRAVDYFNVASPRFPVTFAGAGPGPNFRSNLVLTDTSGHGIDARVQTAGGSGLSSETRVTLEASEEIQESGAVIVQPARGSLIAGVVATDERSSDASYFAPDIPASTTRTIPLIANTDSLVSDLYLLNLSPNVRTVALEVKPYDTNQWPRTQTYRLLPYEARVIVNPLKSLFNMTGMARLRYYSAGVQGDTSGVRVTSRAYITAETGGTYGTAIAPLNGFQSVTAEESLEVFGILNGFKTSLGLVELSPNPRNLPTRVRVSIADDRGNTLDAFETTIQPAGGIYIDDVFKTRNIPQPAAARIIVETLDAWGMVGAYAIVADPLTGDPAYLGPHLVAKPK